MNELYVLMLFGMTVAGLICAITSDDFRRRFGRRLAIIIGGVALLVVTLGVALFVADRYSEWQENHQRNCWRHP